MRTILTGLLLIVVGAAITCDGSNVSTDFESFRSAPACDQYFATRQLDGLAITDFDYTVRLLGLLSAPCLYEVDVEGAELYRVVFQPSFKPLLVATVFAVDDTAWLWSFRVDPDDFRDDEWDSATVRSRSSEQVRPLASREWRQIQDLVRRTRFWDGSPISYVPIEDGALWTLEGWQDNHYSMTRGTAPSSDHRALFHYIIELHGTLADYPRYFES